MKSAEWIKVLEAEVEKRFDATQVNGFEDSAPSIKLGILVWKTGTYLGLEEDQQVEITATIKEHSEYKGKKETVLTRCKVTKLG